MRVKHLPPTFLSRLIIQHMLVHLSAWIIRTQYLRISHYKNSRGGFDCVTVGPDSSCMFSSLRRLITAPFEYRNIHLRRQLVILLANHKVFFFNLKEHIKGTYGFPRQDEEEYQQIYRDGVLTDQEVQDHYCQGPFSYHSYLTALLEPTMWGDEQVLCLCSMMWQIGLTVVSAEEFMQVKFRDKAVLSKVDAVLVMCLGQHYVPAHKYLHLLHPDRCILQPDGCTLHPDGSYLCLDSCFAFFSHCAQTGIHCTWMGTCCTQTGA